MLLWDWICENWQLSELVRFGNPYLWMSVEGPRSPTQGISSEWVARERRASGLWSGVRFL
jgi:hypothetical protein